MKHSAGKECLKILNFQNTLFSHQWLIRPLHGGVFMNIHRLYCIYFLFFSEHNLLGKLLDINYQFSQEISCTSGSTEGFLGAHYVQIMRCENELHSSGRIACGRRKKLFRKFSKTNRDRWGLFIFHIFFLNKLL